MASWYFVKDGERKGPLPRAELDARIADGVVDADTLVWSVGMSAWVRAGVLPELGLPPPLPAAPALPPTLPANDLGDLAAGASGSTVSDAAREEARRRALELVDRELAKAGGARPDSSHAFAGFWIRLAAKLIDFTILIGISILVQRGVAALYFDGVVPNLTTDWTGWLNMASITAPINTAIGIAYSAYFIAQHEATPGKRMLGLRVIRADGARLSTGRVIGRYFAEQLSGIVFLAGYVMAAFDDEKRGLHDYICDTRVVKGERDPVAHADPRRIAPERQG